MRARPVGSPQTFGPRGTAPGLTRCVPRRSAGMLPSSMRRRTIGPRADRPGGRTGARSVRSGTRPGRGKRMSTRYLTMVWESGKRSVRAVLGRCTRNVFVFPIEVGERQGSNLWRLSRLSTGGPNVQAMPGGTSAVRPPRAFLWAFCRPHQAPSSRVKRTPPPPGLSEQARFRGSGNHDRSIGIDETESLENMARTMWTMYTYSCTSTQAGQSNCAKSIDFPN